MLKVSIRWLKLEDGTAALLFEPAAWRLFEITAAMRETDAEAMVADAVIGVLGNVFHIQ